MKKLLLVGSLISLAFAQPQISVSETSYDFGMISVGDSVIVHTFEISNTGDETLHIQDVKPGCSCTIVDFPKSLEPGEIGEFKSEFRTVGKSGVQHRPFTIISTSEENPILRLSITGFLLGSINMERHYGIIRLEEDATTVSDSIGIVSMKEDLAITSAYYKQRENEDGTPGKRFDINATIETREAGSSTEPTEFQLLFNFPVDIEMSESGTVYFSTNHPMKSELEYRCIIRRDQ